MATVLRLNPGHAGLLQLDERVGEDADDEDEKETEQGNSATTTRSEVAGSAGSWH
jgi:hypothetical protein